MDFMYDEHSIVSIVENPVKRKIWGHYFENYSHNIDFLFFPRKIWFLMIFHTIYQLKVKS